MSIWDYRATTTDRPDDQTLYPRVPKTNLDAKCKACGKSMHSTIEELNKCLKSLKRSG